MAFEYRTKTAVAANEPETSHAGSPAYWVCLALLLATVVLAMRIATRW